MSGFAVCLLCVIHKRRPVALNRCCIASWTQHGRPQGLVRLHMPVLMQALQHRADGKLYRIQTPQTPIARTKRYNTYKMDEFPSGMNMIVCVLAYTGQHSAMRCAVCCRRAVGSPMSKWNRTIPKKISDCSYSQATEPTVSCHTCYRQQSFWERVWLVSSLLLSCSIVLCLVGKLCCNSEPPPAHW